MTISLSKYASNKPFVKWYYEYHKDSKDICLISTEIALATHVPVIVISYYLLDLHPCIELEKQIASLKIYYRIEEVVS